MMKLAILDIDPRLVSEGVGVLYDHGLTVMGSLESSFVGNVVRLVIAGDGLPDECTDQHPLKSVKVVMATSSYGSQRINRIEEIKVIG